MYVLVPRLLLCAALVAGLTASAVAGSGCDGKKCSASATQKNSGSVCTGPQSPCGHPCSANQNASACHTKACGASACAQKCATTCEEMNCRKGPCPGCPADCCDEECCEDYGCCTGGCPCDEARCTSAATGKACQQTCTGNACCEGRNCAEFCGHDCCDDDGCEAACHGESCCSETADNDDSGCCCDGWFFGNWLRSWNGGKSKSVANKSFAPGMKCEKFQATFPMARIYGQAATTKNGQQTGFGCCTPLGAIRLGFGFAPAEVTQATAEGCACGCSCQKCPCGKANKTANQAAAACPAGRCPMRNSAAPAGVCPFGFNGSETAARFGMTAPHGRPNFIAAPVPPPVCPAMGPHAGLFEKMAHVMAENAALKARLDAKQQHQGEQDCLRAALTEARQEIARLNGSQQPTAGRDQVLIEWLKAQAESSARKDEMLVEMLGAIVEMQAGQTEGACCEKFEAKFQQMELALKRAQEDNARLRNEISQLRKERTRVSTPAEPTSYPRRHDQHQRPSSDPYKVQY